MSDYEAIRQVVYKYCRGIDRREFDLVRDCYHVDGKDDHGDYRGGIDGFIEYVTEGLKIWDNTNHFVGNVLIDLNNETARVESYAIAYHRRNSQSNKVGIDFTAGIRYIDDFQKRGNDWRIFTRICLIDWTRTDAIGDRGWTRPDTYTQPSHGLNDPVFANDLRNL